MRWFVPVGTVVYAVPSRIPEIKWECPHYSIDYIFEKDAWAEFVKWADETWMDKNDDMTRVRWDDYMKRTAKEVWFEQDTDYVHDEAITWPINTDYWFIPITDNLEFSGFLVEKRNCEELQF